MNCTEIRETLSAESDGQACDKELIAAYHHLAECPACRKWRREMQTIKNVLSRRENIPVPQTVIRRLEKTSTTKRIYRIPRPLAWVAVAVVALQIGWSSYQLISRSDTSPGQRGIDLPTTIVLTAKDRTSSTIVVRTSPETNPQQNQKRHGG